MVRITLSFAAIYLGAIGLALLIVPLKFGIGAVPVDPPAALVALLRLLGGPFLGIAVLNWLTRRSPHSPVRPVLIANLVGFATVAANDVWGVATGEARDLARYFLLIHLAFAVAFAVLVGRGKRSL